jgi:hypothetical protein
MKTKTLLLILTFSFISTEFCEDIKPTTQFDCLKYTNQTNVCCHKLVRNTLTKTEEVSCTPQTINTIGTTHYKVLNSLETNIECGNNFKSCSHDYAEVIDDCKKAGEYCCFKYYQNIGKCFSLPQSKDFVNMYNKYKNDTIQCSGEILKISLLMVLSLFLL